MTLNLRITMSCCGALVAIGIGGCGGHVVASEDPAPDSGGAGAATTSGAGGMGGECTSGGTGGSSGATGGSSGGTGGSSGSGGTSGSSGGSSGSSGGSSDGSGGSSGSGGGSSGAGGGDGGACYAACGTPAGTVASFTSAEQVYAALVGIWQICPGSGKVFVTAPPDTAGVEYAPPGERGGNMYYLVQGASGLERGAGFDYQLTYDVSQSGTHIQLNMHPTPNSGFGGSFRFSPCPIQWQMGAMYGTDKAILMPAH